MAKRSYKQNCALAQASDLIGERWSLLLLRELLVASRKFNDLQNSLKGIGTNLLATRLKDLEAAGILERQAQGGAGHVYALTESGRALEPALLALVRWGLSYGPDNQKGYHHRDDWDLVALKALFQARRAGELSVCVQFRTNAFAGWISIADKRARIGLGENEAADVVLRGTIRDLFAVPESATLLAGSRDRLQRFKSAFVLPG